MNDSRLNLLQLRNPSIRTLHFTWVAFFITFVMWFNHAPLVLAIKETFNLTAPQWKALLILNVALTIPARIMIGMLVSEFVADLRLPNPAFIRGAQELPMIERNPVRFWQALCLILAIGWLITLVILMIR